MDTIGENIRSNVEEVAERNARETGESSSDNCIFTVYITVSVIYISVRGGTTEVKK